MSRATDGLRAYSPRSYSCHRETGDGIELDGDTCDRDWFEVTLIRNRTYKLQLESGTNVLIDGVYRFGSLYQKGGTNLHSEIEWDSLHLGSRHERLHRTSWLHRQLHPDRDRGVAPLGRRSAAVRCQRGSLLIAVASNGRQPTPVREDRRQASVQRVHAPAGGRHRLTDHG